jgi:hypothetical protein
MQQPEPNIIQVYITDFYATHGHYVISGLGHWPSYSYWLIPGTWRDDET